MDPLLWWTILLCLIALITVSSLYLCCSLFRDNFKRTKINRISAAPSHSIKLNKYKFGRTDVEDLTRIEKNYQSFSSRISFVNEVESPKPQQKISASQPSTPRVSRQRKGSLLPDIHESRDYLEGLYSVEDIMNEVNAEKTGRRNSEMLMRRFSLVTEGMRKNSLVTIPQNFSFKLDNKPNGESTDTLDCLDPITIEIKRDMADIEEDVHKIDYEINYFLGNAKNLKYYEINERLIRLSMALSDLHCGSDELRKIKKEVQIYINQCKDKLNSKVA